MKKKIGRIAVNIILILLIIAGYLGIKTKIGNIVDSTEVILNDNWSVSINDEVLEETTLKDAFFPVTNTGDRVELTTTLPDITMKRPTLQFKIYHSCITVYLDGEELYRYGDSLKEQGEMVGSGFYRVSLPKDCAGKELKICFDVTEDNAFSSVEDIFIMEENKVTKNFILKNIIEVIIGIFLFSFGILLTGVVLFSGKGGSEYRILLWIAIFSIAVSLWMLSSKGILQLIYDNLNVIAYFEYLSLYCAPIPLLLFVWDSQDQSSAKKIIGGFIGILAAFDIIVLILNEFNIYHFSKVLPIFHVLGFCTIALTTVSNILTWKHQNKKSDRTILKGIGIMLVFLFADTLRFNIDKYIHPKNINLSSSILPIGVLAFVIAMIASYIYRLVQIFYENAEKQTLIQIAYTDALTKIGNRAMCEKIFQERDKEKPTTIINFDLNHFKEVNDNFGHGTGDILLEEFASILKTTYKKNAFVGRMGGDEFIVVLDNNDSSFVEKTLARLLEKIEKLNKKEDRIYQISVAYGYCSNKEHKDVSLWELYEASDKKMYQNKTEHR